MTHPSCHHDTIVSEREREKFIVPQGPCTRVEHTLQETRHEIRMNAREEDERELANLKVREYRVKRDTT